jgi:hypothetical protein
MVLPASSATGNALSLITAMPAGSAILSQLFCQVMYNQFFTNGATEKNKKFLYLYLEI